jgi:hypothetical protein
MVKRKSVALLFCHTSYKATKKRMITVKWVILKGMGHGPIEVLSRYFNGDNGETPKTLCQSK